MVVLARYHSGMMHIPPAVGMVCMHHRRLMLYHAVRFFFLSNPAPFPSSTTRLPGQPRRHGMTWESASKACFFLVLFISTTTETYHTSKYDLITHDVIVKSQQTGRNENENPSASPPFPRRVKCLLKWQEECMSTCRNLFVNSSDYTYPSEFSCSFFI